MPFLGSVYQIFGFYPEIYHVMMQGDLEEECCENREEIEEQERED